MFTSVLIAEDHESANISIRETLKELGIAHIKYAYHCDDAMLHLNNSITDSEPYQLLVADLSFDDDGRPQAITDGIVLIDAARNVHPALKILIFSGEQKEAVVAGLFKDHCIDGYVCKGRKDAQALKEAIESIWKGKRYYPLKLQAAIRQQNAYDFTPFDRAIISELAAGKAQKAIPDILKQSGFPATSLSSIEKRLHQIKAALNFTKNEQLAAYCKEKGII